MDATEFWRIVDASRADKQETQLRRLKTELKALAQ